MPRTSSPRCWAPTASISRAPPRSTACRRCPRAGCCGCRRCSPASGRRRGRPAVARLGARAQCAGRPGAARARARAEAGAGAAAAQAQRHGDREVDRQPLRHLRPAHPAAGAAAPARPSSPMRRCAARSCTTRSAASRTRFPRALARRHLRRAGRAVRKAALAGADRLAARGGVLGAALRPLRRLVRRDRGRPARRASSRTVAEVEGARAGRRGRALHADGARRPHRYRADGGLVITDYKTGGDIKDLAGRAVQGEAPQLPLEAAIAAAGGFTGVPARDVGGCATSPTRAASRRGRNAPSRPTTWRRWHAQRATGSRG